MLCVAPESEPRARLAPVCQGDTALPGEALASPVASVVETAPGLRTSPLRAPE